MNINEKIAQNIATIQTEIARYQTGPVQFMAVTKYATLEQTNAIIESGITLLGENKVQNGIEKIQTIQNPALTWHLIGHLQSNKAKKAIAHFQTIQSVDSLKLLEKLNTEAANRNLKTAILLEINIGNEPQKHGFTTEDIHNLHPTLFGFSHIEINGIMVIPPASPNPENTRPYFQDTKKLYDSLKAIYTDIHTLSMGMSHDYKVALQEGASLIRIGSALLN